MVKGKFTEGSGAETNCEQQNTLVTCVKMLQWAGQTLLKCDFLMMTWDW